VRRYLNVVNRLEDPTYVAREYATLDRLAMRRLDRTGWLRYDELDEEQTLLTALAEARPRRILDVGCGDGRIPSTYAGADVVCVDSSEAAVAAARGRGLEVVQADARELPFAEGSFDAVTCNHALYHLDDPGQALAEFVRVLRPGGRFAGIYNTPAHLRELWDAVGADWARDRFDAESGLPYLERRFARVERRIRGGSVLWLGRDDLQRYLDAYRELLGSLTAPEAPYPFVATRAKCVFVADAA
jgi:SAM-dependent methyltransferase